MLRGLLPRLALSFVGVSLGTLLLVLALVNLLLARRFEAYVTENLALRAEQFAAALTSGWERERRWNAGAAMNVAHLAMMEGLAVRVTGPDGSVLLAAGDASGGGAAMMPGMMMPMPGTGGGMAGMTVPMPSRAARNPVGGARGAAGKPFSVALPLRSGGADLGTLTISTAGGAGVFTDHDLHFVAEANRLLLAAAAAAALLSLAVGLLAARRLSAPLLAMAALARRMSRGDLDRRIPVDGATEMQELGRALNQLAESLQNQERLRKRLTADVAHELRTPLASLRSHLEAMIDGVWEATADRLAVAHQEVMRLVRLVGDLEQLTTAEAEGLRLHRQPLPVGELIDQAAQSLASLFKEKGVELHLEPAPPELVCSVDRDKIVQVLVNLLSNAYKFTPAGGHVTVSASARGGDVAVSIRDTGTGIAAADLPHIFERFYRGEPSRARKTGGAGIGLAIARALVQAHGGRIEVESAPGAGSTFTVLLPQVRGEGDAARSGGFAGGGRHERPGWRGSAV